MNTGLQVSQATYIAHVHDVGTGGRNGELTNNTVDVPGDTGHYPDIGDNIIGRQGSQSLVKEDA